MAKALPGPVTTSDSESATISGVAAAIRRQACTGYSIIQIVSLLKNTKANLHKMGFKQFRERLTAECGAQAERVLGGWKVLHCLFERVSGQTLAEVRKFEDWTHRRSLFAANCLRRTSFMIPLSSVLECIHESGPVFRFSTSRLVWVGGLPAKK